MNPRWRHAMRRIWFTAGGVFAAVAIALAVLMALGQLLVPLAAHFPDRVAHLLSERLDRPVRFASMQGHWQPSGPLLVLHDVTIGGRDGKPALTLPTARVKLDFGALIMPSRHWVNLRLSGLKLSLERDRQGQWHVAGFGVAGQGTAQHLSLDDLPGNLWLDDLELDIIDARSGHHYRIRAGPVRVSNGGGELRFAGQLHRGASRVALKVAGVTRAGGRTGRLYIAASDADFGRMLAGASMGDYAVLTGQGDLALWLSWRDARLTASTLRVDLRDLKVRGPDGSVNAPKLRGIVQYRRDANGTQVLFAPGVGGAARMNITGSGEDTRIVARAENLDTGSWHALVSLMPGLPASLARWLVAAQPEVHFANAHVDWSRAQGLRAMAVHFDHLALRAAAGRPGVTRAYGVLRGAGDTVSLTLPAQPLTLDFGHVFREPLVFSSVGGGITFSHGAQGWQAVSPGIDFTGRGLAGELRGRVALPAGGGKPFLDLYAIVTRGNVTAARQFWPVSVMSPAVVTWLDRALAGGRVEGARIILRGNLADWPFTNHKGRFEARVHMSGLALDYAAKWPSASGVAGTVDFVDNGLLATITAGSIRGVDFTHAVASIPVLGKSKLILEVEGKGKASDLLDFVRTSPVGASHATVLDGLTLDGATDFDFSMVLPLAHTAPDSFTLAGTVRLHAADVAASDWSLTLGGVNGALVFDRHGFRTRGLTGTFHGQPVQLAIAAGSQTGHDDWPLTVDLEGRFSLAQLAVGRDELAPLAKLGIGSAPFDIHFHIDDTAANAVRSTQVLRVESNLRGIALDLPQPLAKPAQALWPLDLRMGLPAAGGRLQVILGNRLFARARLPTQQQPGAVEVRLGGLAPSAPMPASGIRVRGRAEHLDISGWARRALSAAGGVKAKMPPVDVDVTGENTHILGQTFKDLRVQFEPSSTQLKLLVDGAAIKGAVSVPVHDINKRGIVARFERLYWPRAQEVAGATSPAPTASVAAAPTRAEAADVGVAPSSLPPLHAWIADLRLGDARLGQARLETYPTAKGMHIDILRTQSDSVHMSASGDWNGTAHASHTQLAITFSAANLGHMLDAFGFDGLITGGQTQAKMDATWPGAPASFALAKINGTLSVDIGEGRIPEVKPGVGRLFGLMSIAELPAHLTVDFGNMFSKGFNFHSISGHFRFEDGNAWTKDLKIDGLGADITVTGRVGLRAHDYDQYVLAIPHIGNTLPIVGAVVGGPVGAAAGFAIQGLLGKGLNKAASARYHITGSWAKPKITLVSKNVPVTPPVPPASTAAPAPAASAPRTAQLAPQTSAN